MPIREVDIEELHAVLTDGARLFDVREVDEYQQGHVPGAILVPLGSVPESVDSFRGEGTAYVICRSGGRSMKACEFLQVQGLDVANVAGGTMSWIESGRAVSSGEQPA